MTSQNLMHETTAFEQERSRLVSDITQELGQLISNVNLLNRNLDTIITIGQDFEQLSQLWQSFHTSPFQEQLQQELARLEEFENDDITAAAPIATKSYEQQSPIDEK